MQQATTATMHVEVCVFTRRCLSAAFRIAVAALLMTIAPEETLAQSDDSVGVRAQGMAGAFTAVADDASATWWNPAGLGAWNSSGTAGGSFLNAIVDLAGWHEPSMERDSGGVLTPARRVGIGGFSIASAALGLSYYRLRLSEIQPITSTAPQGGVRQDQGTADVYLRSLVLHQFGATVGQSLGEHLVVGSTLKLVHGRLGAGMRPAVDASLDQAADLGAAGETHGGIDLGAMATFGEMRLV